MTELSARQIANIVNGKLYGNGDVKLKTVSTDSRSTDTNTLFVALKGERFDGNDFLEAVDEITGCAIASRFAKVSYPLIVVENTLEALTSLSKYYAKNIMSTDLTVSLTGSVGKTTTKEMVSCVLAQKLPTACTKGNFNNHIGVPLTLLSVEKHHRALVCEMGMNHKGELLHLAGLVDSDVALITNIGHSHIENLGSREGIRNAKLEILAGLKKGGAVVINGDEPLLKDVRFDGRIIRVGYSDSCDIRADRIAVREEGLEYDLHTYGETRRMKLSCAGRHNVINSLFAVAVGILAEMSLDDIQAGLLNYAPTGFRQNIYFKNGIRVIADCYNAGIESMKASLEMMSELSCRGKRVAVLSDMLELGDISEKAHTEVGEAVAACRTDLLFTVGDAAKYIYEKAKTMGTTARHFDDKHRLAEELRVTLKEGDTVLFKASHSMKLEEVISLTGLEK